MLSTGNLFTGLQYSSFVQKLDTSISNNYNGSGFINSQDRQQEYRINVFAYRFDIEKSFDNGLKVETGTNLSVAKANAPSNIRFFEMNGETTVDFDYAETNFAGYSQLSGKLCKKIGFNVGLRIEKQYGQK